MEVETDAPPSASLAQKQLDQHLAVLRLLPGATSVTDFPNGGVFALVPGLQGNGVRLKLDGRLIKQTFNDIISDKATAARVLKDRMKDASYAGEAAVLAAEEQVRLKTQPTHERPPEPEELSTAELQWLTNWYDEQPAPDEVTLEQANAALAKHRESSGGTSATQVLFEAQVTTHS